MSRKRERSDSTFETIRVALAGRVNPDTLPLAWRDAAALAGARGTDAFLCFLARSIAAALHTLSEASEAEARVALLASAGTASTPETCSCITAAVIARCGELSEEINAAEAVKHATLERELCTVDETLERWRAICVDVGEALVSGDAELALRLAALINRLDELDARLLVLPTAAPVEPPHVGLVLLAPPVLHISEIGDLGRIVAPHAVTAADLAVECASAYAMPGSILQLRIVPGASHASQSAEELQVSFGAALATTRIEAFLSAEGLRQPALVYSVSAAERSLVVALHVPANTPAGAEVCIGRICVAGQDVSFALHTIPVRHGMHAPLLIMDVTDGATTTPCIALCGELFVPLEGSAEVRVFSADGAPLRSVPVAGLGLSNKTRWAAYVEGDSPTLLLADSNKEASRLVAVYPDSLASRWTTAPGSMRSCRGIAALPSQGVVIAACFFDMKLHAYRLSDGSLEGSTITPGGCLCLAADAKTGTFFAGAVSDVADEDDDNRDEEGQSYRVAAWSWVTGVGFTSLGPVTAAGLSPLARTLAVVPATHGKTVSYLVVGKYSSSELCVLALPSLAHVHTHHLGMEIVGLAADPSGTTIAVCDFVTGIHVLAWPLPGMSPCE